MGATGRARSMEREASLQKAASVRPRRLCGSVICFPQSGKFGGGADAHIPARAAEEETGRRAARAAEKGGGAKWCSGGEDSQSLVRWDAEEGGARGRCCRGTGITLTGELLR
ncbi:unnamed protein product [Lepidochelys olivacea]